MQQIDTTLLEELTKKTKNSPRKRMNYNLHGGPDDPVQRLCNAIESGTYIRPHRHSVPETFEIFVMLRGSAVLLFFDDSGYVIKRTELSDKGPVIGVEIPPQTWHAMASRENGTVFFEVKRGPYIPPSGSNVAAWAPAEGMKSASDFVAWYLNASIGDGPPVILE
jgi:cupin fold WbuC family metalloprotein